MSKQSGPRPARDINKHWQSLAERRRQYLLELHRSGRWRRYYSEDEMQAQIRDVTRTIEGWSVLSGEPPQVAGSEWKKPLGEAAE
jgi:uncharacterized repeat protein (TIGR03809 family)